MLLEGAVPMTDCETGGFAVDLLVWVTMRSVLPCKFSMWIVWFVRLVEQLGCKAFYVRLSDMY